MQLDNPIQALAMSLAHAQYEGFPEYEYQDRDWEHYRNTKEALADGSQSNSLAM